MATRLCVDEASLTALATLVNELRTDLNALRNDFRAHDHGNTGAYVQAVITLRSSANSFTGQAETSTAVSAAAVPALAFSDAQY